MIGACSDGVTTTDHRSEALEAPAEIAVEPMADMMSVSPKMAKVGPAVAESRISIEPPRLPVPPQRQTRAGVVTAGDIDDTLNLGLFARYQAKAASKLQLPKENLTNAISLRLVGPDGKPAEGVSITLTAAGRPDPFYSGYSGVDGVVSVIPAALGARIGRGVTLKAFENGQQIFTAPVSANGYAMKTIEVPTNGGWSPDFLDLVFVIDTTGSMGDELNWLTKEFQSIVQSAQSAAPKVNIRFGLVAYRDVGDDYTVRNFGFVNSRADMQRLLRSLQADGGGDYPEAAAEAMEEAANLQWRRGKGERILFHIADAPPHPEKSKRFLDAAKSAAQKNVQIFGLGASGVAAESEFLMRQASLITGGRYLFLTDDSGIGNSHAEPTVPCYNVTKLRDLLISVLKSELTATRHEPNDSAILRKVGNYHKGICSQ